MMQKRVCILWMNFLSNHRCEQYLLNSSNDLKEKKKKENWFNSKQIQACVPTMNIFKVEMKTIFFK